MQPKSTLPTAEVTVPPLRARAADQGGDRQSVVPIEQPVASVTQGTDGETHQADRALHAMLARLSGGISPGSAAAGLYGLAFASGLVAAATDRDFAGRAGRSEAAFRSCAALLFARAWTVVADQAASAGQALRPAGVGTSAIQSDGAGVSPGPTMVAQRHHGRARRGEAERGDRRVLDPADAGRAVALQFCRDQSGSASEIVREWRQRISCAAGKISAATGSVWRRRGLGRSRPAISSSAKPSRRRPARSCSATI